VEFARPVQARRRWALIWLCAFVALAISALGLAGATSRDPVIAGRSQALADAQAFETTLTASGRVWRAELLAAVFTGAPATPAARLEFRWNAAGGLIQPMPAPRGNELADEAGEAGAESFTPARAWASQARQVAADAAASRDAAEQGIAALGAGEHATAARLRLLAAQACARLDAHAAAAALLAELAAATPPDALLDGQPLALLVGHRLADALEAGGDVGAARLTREELRTRILAAQLPLPAAQWERELRFLREADGDGIALTAIELAAVERARLVDAVATALEEDASRDGLALAEGSALLDPDARRGALFETAALRAALSAAWRELLPGDGSWEIVPPEVAIAPGRTLGAVEPPPGLVGGWRLVLARPEVYVEAFAQRQRGLWLGAGALAAALVTVGWIGRRALLRQAELERMRAEFIAGVSHELRTPAASLALLADNLAQGRIPNEERRREYYAALQRDARRMQRLVADVLDASRLERETFRVEPTPCDPAALLRVVAEEHRARLADAGLRLRVEIADPLPELPLDADAVERALANLLENARKYASGGGEVTLRAGVADGALRIAVEDRGPGVPEAWRARVFEPYERVPGEGSLAAGAGLGLALVRATAQAHGGRVRVEPGADGVGARFVVEIPLTAEGGG
jgi:signal transduction histidine kinase